ncbi:MAG: chromatin protein Cren7 [Candidatus Heimdallarchaeota archaeon]|nr:MAG: chromatin protein Cren7 [Candidatus Heimdallarchaeota archaeon]
MSPRSKKRKKKISCKKCGHILNPTENPPEKTWQLISPMPDKDGRVTLTIMGSFHCPTCNASIRASLKKIRGDEIGSGKSKKELLIQAVNLVEEATSIDQIEIAGISAAAVGKAIETLINQGELSGRVENGIFYPKE